MPDATVHAMPATTAATSGEVTAAGTLWVRPEHVGSMATTTDDILAVYDDGAVCVSGEL